MWSDSVFDRAVHFLRHTLPTLVIARAVRRHKSHPSGDAPRILVTRLDGIGDFVLLSPFLKELRRNFGSSNITLVVGRNVAGLAEACPYVDRVLVLDSEPRKKLFASYPRYLLAYAGYFKYLAAFADLHLVGRIDLAIQPRWDFDSQWATLLTFLSGAPRRIGYSEKTSAMKSWCNWGHDRLFTGVLPPGGDGHEVERNLDIVRYLGGSVAAAAVEVWWGPEEDLAAERFMSGNGLSEAHRLFAFGIGAGAAFRRWPFYGQLIRLLVRDLEFTPLLLAGPGDEDLVREIHSFAPAAPVAQLPLGVTASVLSRCALFIGNDSGPMHLAAAVGLPVIEISCLPVGAPPGHVNSPDRFGPVCAHQKRIHPEAPQGQCKSGCVECVPHCIAAISPETVASEVLLLVKSLGIPAHE
jgi:heptosyltransferase-2